MWVKRLAMEREERYDIKKFSDLWASKLSFQFGSA